MKPEYYIKTLIFILVLAVISFSGCIQNSQNQTSGQNTTNANQTLNPVTSSKYKLQSRISHLIHAFSWFQLEQLLHE